MQVVVGAQLSSVTFVMDYWQLAFDGHVFSIMTWLAVSADGRTTRSGEDGFKDRLCTQITKIVSAAGFVDKVLTVNFEDGSVVRFLQISMEVMAHDQKAIDSVQKNIPLIRNNLLLLMSNRNYQSMMSRDGKDKLRQEALAEVRAVQKKEGSPDVDDILFTSFVVQ